MSASCIANKWMEGTGSKNLDVSENILSSPHLTQEKRSPFPNLSHKEKENRSTLFHPSHSDHPSFQTNIHTHTPLILKVPIPHPQPQRPHPTSTQPLSPHPSSNLNPSKKSKIHLPHPPRKVIKEKTSHNGKRRRISGRTLVSLSPLPPEFFLLFPQGLYEGFLRPSKTDLNGNQGKATPTTENGAKAKKRNEQKRKRIEYEETQRNDNQAEQTKEGFFPLFLLLR